LGEVPKPPEGPKRLGAGVVDEVADADEKPELLGVFELLTAPELLGATELLVAREVLGRTLAEIPAVIAARLRTSSGIMVSFLQ
jgi:hypothetical protein